MDSLLYFPGSWDRLTIIVMGLLIAFLALASIVLPFTRRNGLAERTLALAGGACLGLAIGLAEGIGILALQSRAGGPDFFLAPYNVRAGLLCGVGLGLLALLAVGAIIMLRSIPALGMLLGTLAGLGIFRLIFGPTAGFGGEVGFGVGQEVGIMFGAAGGLLGAILAAIILRAVRSRLSDADNPPPARPGWRWPLIGLALGAVLAALIAVLGAQLGFFQFLVPYNAQIPDVAPDTSPTGMQYDFLFGLGMFAVAGALTGCFLGLQWALSQEQSARRHGVWVGVGMVVALLCGLSFGLDHRGVGGPLLAVQSQIPREPAASVTGLLAGLAGGIVLGVLLLVGARLARPHTRWYDAVRMAMTLIVGLLLLTLPYWYTPIFAISIY